MKRHLKIIALLLISAITLLWAGSAARAQSGANPENNINCARVKEFIGYMSLNGKGLKGDFVEKNQFGENEYKALKTITTEAGASYFENPPSADEFGGITTIATYSEDLYTTTIRTDADQKCQQYIQQFINCGYTGWEPNLDEPQRKEYLFIDYTDTGDLYLYLGYQLVDQTDWIIYLDMSWTTYK